MGRLQNTPADLNASFLQVEVTGACSISDV